MQYRLTSWFQFYSPIFLLSILATGAAVVLSGLLTSEMNFKFGRLCYAALNPLMHFTYYEYLRPHEYYYYRNLQWSKRELWLISLFVSILLALC
jgi:hypothetical protein